jgi:hypothetical protein
MAHFLPGSAAGIAQALGRKAAKITYDLDHRAGFRYKTA